MKLYPRNFKDRWARWLAFTTFLIFICLIQKAFIQIFNFVAYLLLFIGLVASIFKKNNLIFLTDIALCFLGMLSEGWVAMVYI